MLCLWRPAREILIRHKSRRNGQWKVHTVSRTANPVNIALVGGNGCRVCVRNVKFLEAFGDVLLDRWSPQEQHW